MEQKTRSFKDLRKFIPFPVALLIFLLITIIYVSPILEGKKLFQPDIVNWKGMSREVVEYREQTGEEALWTNTMFSGMPAFQISVMYGNNISNLFHRVMTLWLPRPADMIFLYFAGFFIFLLVLKTNVWVAFAGALAFSFSSYHFIILEAGHNSKAVAIGYMAPVMASIIYAYRGHYIRGGILFAIFMGLQLFANHFQITYYLGIIALFYVIFKLAYHIKENSLRQFLKATGFLFAGLILAIGVNIGNFWSTWAYTPHTMRGGSELTIEEREAESGLSTEYITNWSYGIGETFSLLIPNVKGGSSGALGESLRAMNAVEPAARRIIGQQNQYWGDQPFTSGPVYVGAVVLFFFFISLFYVKGPLKWGLLLAIILSIMLSWGKNFMFLTEFFINNIPGYNKFRAVSMTLVIAEFSIPALAFLGLHHLYQNPDKINLKSKSFLTALGLTAGVALLFWLTPRTFFSFLSQQESQFFSSQEAQGGQMAAQYNQVLYNLENARIAIFKADAIRSFLFSLAAAVVVLLLASRKIKPVAFVAIISVLILVDMWPVNRRYLNDTNFEPARRVENPFQPNQANLQIMQDDDEYFRVFNRTVNTFNDASTSWFHYSIGGYHGAKLQRYQDIIDFHLSPSEGIITQPNIRVLNMLNTKYFIVFGDDDRPAARLNNQALGNAWFVESVRMVEDADQEILALSDFDPATQAIVDQRFADHLSGFNFQYDDKANIQLTEYQPNRLKYSYNASDDQLAVFSEIYYPDGWQVTVNGEPAEHFRVNYILRAMVLPAGENEVEFIFTPPSYNLGNLLALFFSIVLAAIILWFLFISFKKYQAQEKTA